MAILVNHLQEWAEENANGRSVSFPLGWIDADALRKLADAVEKKEPFPYVPKFETEVQDG